MRIFKQNKLPRSKRSIMKFKGLDRRLKASSEYFRKMTNMSGDEKLCAASRKPRGRLDLANMSIFSMVTTDVVIDGIMRENAFILDTGNRLKAFYYEDGEMKSTDIMNTVYFTTGANKMIASGGYLYFFPDKKYINLMNIRESGSLDATATTNSGIVTDFEGTFFFETLFESTDESGKERMEDSGYVKLSCSKNKLLNGGKGELINHQIIGVHFSVGDTVRFEGADELDGLHRVVYISDDLTYIVVRGELPELQRVSTRAVTVSRSIPDMDYVVSAGNRLWGCRYGVNEDGKPVNEIYASALGDPKNWNTFEGVSTDSYVASIGEDGTFTGAVVYEGDPVFFKEDAMLRIYGTKPSDFTVLTSNIRGIEKGSHKSCILVDDTLYYNTHSGIVAYNGGIPYNIDGALGDIKYSDAIAGAVGGRYYVSLKRDDGTRELMVYDTSDALWYREDDIDVVDFCRCGDELYMVASDGDASAILSVCGSGTGKGEGEVCWDCETGDISCEVNYRKYVSKVEIRLERAEKSSFEAYISYDGAGEWHKVASVSGKERLLSVPVFPRRCESFRLRFSGNGECRILSVVTTETTCGDNR